MNKTREEREQEGMIGGSAAVATPQQPMKLSAWFKKYYSGYLFVLPVVLGMLIFTFIPMLSSLIYSFCDYDVVNPPTFVGLQNYIRAFTVYWAETGNSLKVTFIYALVSIPLEIVLSFLLAVLLSQNIRGVRLFRTIYYLPCLIPGIVSSILWVNIFDMQYGVANHLLELVGLPPYTWFSESHSAMPTLIFTSLFTLGASLLLWVSAIKSIDTQYYEVAVLEGAGPFTRLLKITVPMCTATIFYKLVTGIIAALQVFTSAFVITNSRATPDNALDFYAVVIYRKAFDMFRMGYASALAWILFIIIAILTFIVFKTNKNWVFYGEE